MEVDNKGGVEENAVVEGSWGGAGGYFGRHCCSPSSSSRVASGNIAPHTEPPKILARIPRLPSSSAPLPPPPGGKEDGNGDGNGMARRMAMII